jgi:hypothetical protein
MKYQSLKNPIGLVDGTTQWHDPFIEELHETRRKLLAKAGNNMHQLILNAQQTAVKHGFVVGV